MKSKNYFDFVEKFKPKLTTDDCYTPPAVYEAVVEWVKANADIDGRPIVRPFWPGGDFETFDYPPGCVVIDNPPFSIFRKIVLFYIERGIDFFLFGPHLTLFLRDVDAGVSYVVAAANVTYENGAIVSTSFVSSLFPGTRIILAGTLRDALEAAGDGGKKARPKIDVPPSVVTVARLGACVCHGEDVLIPCAESSAPRSCFGGRKMYGSACLLSDSAALSVSSARKRAARAGPSVFLRPTEEEASILALLNGNKGFSVAAEETPRPVAGAQKVFPFFS